METLVRRLGRIFSAKENIKTILPQEKPNWRTERLEAHLECWIRDKGWRTKTRTYAEAADQLGTDTVTLHRYFERQGTDFLSWRTGLRIEDAKRLLIEEPHRPASEIGHKAGFSDRSNFARQFLAHVGCTPGQWRKEAGISHDIPAPENDYV